MKLVFSPNCSRSLSSPSQWNLSRFDITFSSCTYSYSHFFNPFSSPHFTFHTFWLHEWLIMCINMLYLQQWTDAPFSHLTLNSPLESLFRVPDFLTLIFLLLCIHMLISSTYVHMLFAYTHTHEHTHIKQAIHVHQQPLWQLQYVWLLNDIMDQQCL